VSVKYITKNIIIDGMEVFLATINHSSAVTNSSRNFRLIATRVWKVWLSGCLVCPLKKMRNVTNAINVNEVDKTAIS
jgi:hypothetical protein